MALLQTKALGSPALGPDPSQREVLAAARKAQSAKRRAVDDARRPAGGRRPSLRRVKDSKEQLRTTRARGHSNATIESSSPSTTGGRSFTVANINNGIIYLRPVVRPANQRGRPSPAPEPFAYPQTPPDSATLESKANALSSTSNECEQSLYGPRTPTRSQFEPPLPADVTAEDDITLPRPAHFESPPRPSAHIRSRSFSTADDHTVTSNSTEPGTFKVVIERPPFGRGRPKTADTSTFPILEVPIPHYRLGEPQFSARGTAILRSSLYTSAAGSEDFRSSLLTPQRAANSFLSSRPRSDVYSPIPLSFRSTMDRLPRQPSSEPASARISKLPIGPQIYDSLTINPDDSAVVRFSSSGTIVAATPSRLVAHITSPSFLDYELLSDFFLTFRAFLSTRDLVAYLVSRLKWAVDRQDDFGRIVRVRTFVALRHWILNYFVDDFVPVYRLRVYFCELVNSLHQDLRAREDGGAGDIKIVGELKKCWRRTCALYWESAYVFGQDGADDPLLPGGEVQSQTSMDEPVSIPPLPSTPPRRTGRSDKVDTITSNPSDQFAGKHMDWAQKARHTPQNSLSSPYVNSQEFGPTAPLSPASERSMQVMSCSIPMRGLNRPDTAHDMPLYPHPVPHPVPVGPSRFTTSPQHAGSVKKSSRPSHGHKRSGSFSDALRDNRAPLSLPKNVPTDIALSAISKMPGSLVRGGLFQPSSPYVDVKNGSLRHMRSHLELAVLDTPNGDIHIRGGSTHNPGMRKLLGSVRRALSSKQPSASAPQLQAVPHPQGTSLTHLSNTGTVSSVSGGVHKRRHPRSRPHVRIDALASVVSESFKHAVMEQMNSDQQRSTIATLPSLSGFEFNFEKEKAVTNAEPTLPPKDENLRLHSDITNGSKSILIVDDTAAPPLPMMSGALPSLEKEDVPVMIKKSPPLQKDISKDAQLPNDKFISTCRSDLHNSPTHGSSLEPTRTSRTSLQPSFTSQRRSVSAGREYMHSFRRRGSTKTAMARPASLRRHSSFHSGLGRSHDVPSMATFQTMSSNNDPFFLDRQPPDAAPGPARQLRRRPGGDLRAVDNVHDLEQPQRPHSTGTVSNRTHSIANSVILRSDRYIGPSEEVEEIKEDASESESPKTKPISLVATHSSQPNLRPSFEVEVAKLAALPDDIDDDGGIESALMKLEGRYEKKSPDLSKSAEQSPHVSTGPEVYHPVSAPAESTNPSWIPSEVDSSQPRSYAKGDDVFHRPLAAPEAEGQGMYRLSGEAFNGRVPPVHSTVESDDSYSSIPLLDRGFSEITSPERARTLETMRSSAKPAPLKTGPVQPTDQRTKGASASSSIEYVIKTDSMKRIPTDGTLPIQHESSLHGDDEDLSDMGSSRGTRSEGTSHGVRSFYEDEPATEDNEKEFVPTHPMRHPPTPPLTANRLKDSLPQVDTTVFDRGLPTPGLTPTSRLTNQPFGHASQAAEPPIELQELRKESAPSTTAHLPFILAYDSELLAQQFTIVEKDALDEIDWRELIELRWKQSSPQIRDWVQYLRTQEARGVDVVIARFNLVVKWAVSQCILTESMEERARCIIKLIHIAAHARRLRNYATMYQLTIALLSNDVSRLRKTWSLVPAVEMHTMRELEALVQPLRNFHNLRVEMETATGEEGCIPFIGIYTRDLIYNAQKSAFIDAPPVDGERLVNFERHHTAATIVKSLLRLLEASSRYNFRAEPTVVSKCLWLAALSDEEITQRSRSYE
ncbi:ras GEF [Byssothecium circinans]|uniref:Ras GEF n=1 Tax=Byssothecium circinans TaxID=147558 RepID=A0A6A5UF76_9PLEO|nr:ras GEF [Byssothecium circinans]